MKRYYSYSLQGPRDPDDFFKVMDSEVKVTDNIFKNALFRRTHADGRFVGIIKG